ncbi:MAG: sulfite exporter TauE/SafE family protein [Candidatus Abyssobacteria bacterium SURF_17]|uniref:Probable membrane transporter protein n=1 Tax=Candidatus Abyssobacteria bacterium SURF_17 TaxID=2093361 RepID=A0A419F9T6_9BACT|nr:MAG: sulfite exporter TauE/SafE family protein [Candidatus Abyssubacteria bacterium SURF_17]
MHFPVSGVDVHPFVPIVVAFFVSFFTSIGGISGAFLLLPFQMSILKFTAPSVSPTNMIFNIVAIPSGVYRFIKEERMTWPLAWIIVLGALPGVLIGAIIRIRFLPDPRAFKLFVGCVLLYMGYRLIADLFRKSGMGVEQARALEEKFRQRVAHTLAARKGRLAAGLPPDAVVRTISWTFNKVSYEFYGERFSFNPSVVFSLAFVVGIIGGIYGIGGGAIIAPFIVAFLRLPVYTIAGAALLGTFVTSVAGVIVYLVLEYWYSNTGLAIAPDWLLGFFFGIGGFAGIYCGARAQKYLPQKVIKSIIATLIITLAARYVIEYFA